MDRNPKITARPRILKAGVLILAAVLAAGCSSRQPIGKLSLHINLDKEVYKEVVKEDGTSAWDVMAMVGVGFSSGGGTSTSGGVGINIPLTNEIAIVGYNADRLSEVAFRQPIKWGERSYDVDVYAKDMIVVIEGSGPGGRIDKFIGELHHGDAAKAYEVILRKVEPQPKPAGTSPQPVPESKSP